MNLEDRPDCGRLCKHTGQLDGATIPVFGAGSSGLAAAELLRSQQATPLLIDERGAGSGLRDFPSEEWRYPFAVISPGFPSSHRWRREARKVQALLVAEVELGASFWQGKLLCVTGTNGKTTLTRLLEEALRANEEVANSCGNIGKPLTALVVDLPNSANTWAVCEVSSFQLYDWDRPKPDVAFWTNFAEDHFDWHGSIEEYFFAKWKLVESGCRVYADMTLGKLAEKMGLTVPDNLRLVGDQGPLPTGGIFSEKPFSSLYSLALQWWLDSGRDPEILSSTARNFSGLPHRFEKLGVSAGRMFINDSKATNFHAAIAACDSADRPLCWIGGGSSKGGDLREFGRSLSRRIDRAEVYGATAQLIGGFLKEEGIPTGIHDRLEEAFGAAVEGPETSGSVLLSPGFASFDQFSGYSDRGDSFRQMYFGLLKSTEFS